MNIEKLTTNSLKLLLSNIRTALCDDDAHEPSQKEYKVRENLDFRQQSDQFEAELIKRKVQFLPLVW